MCCSSPYFLATPTVFQKDDDLMSTERYKHTVYCSDTLLCKAGPLAVQNDGNTFS